MKKLNILVDRGFSDSYLKLLSGLLDIDTIYKYDHLITGELTSKSKIDLVVFTGGEDVSPSLYNEKTGSRTNCSESRDREESTIFRNFYNTPKLGICRGSQFLTVMNGGKLIQHVEGHANGNHKMEVDINGKIQVYETTSTHHQMLYPYNLPHDRYNLIAWSKNYMSDIYLNGEDKQMKLPDGFLEPEIVEYPLTRSLAIQGHPEFSNYPDSTKDLIYKLIDNLIYGK